MLSPQWSVNRILNSKQIQEECHFGGKKNDPIKIQVILVNE